MMLWGPGLLPIPAEPPSGADQTDQTRNATTPLSLGVVTAIEVADPIYCNGAHPEANPEAVAAFMVLRDDPVGWGFHAAFVRWVAEMRDRHRAEGVHLNFEEWISGMTRTALHLPQPVDPGQ